MFSVRKKWAFTFVLHEPQASKKLNTSYEQVTNSATFPCADICL
jgi:hypothetical protein